MEFPNTQSAHNGGKKRNKNNRKKNNNRFNNGYQPAKTVTNQWENLAHTENTFEESKANGNRDANTRNNKNQNKNRNNNQRVSSVRNLNIDSSGLLSNCELQYWVILV